MSTQFDSYTEVKIEQASVMNFFHHKGNNLLAQRNITIELDCYELWPHP